MSTKRSRVHPPYKTKYRVGNWAEYDQALVGRGDLTLWFSRDAIATWTPRPRGTRGAQTKYSDLAIETALTLRLVFHLPLRQTEGFLRSIFRLMNLDLTAPDHCPSRKLETQPQARLPSHASWTVDRCQSVVNGLVRTSSRNASSPLPPHRPIPCRDVRSNSAGNGEHAPPPTARRHAVLVRESPGAAGSIW